MKSQAENRFITSIIVPDRVGLLRDVTQAVFAMEGNIGEIRQTLVDGFFSLVFTSAHPDEVSLEAFRSILAGALEESAVITVLEKDQCASFGPEIDGSRYVVTTRGRDKPGTICAISGFLVEHNINIEDWIVDEEDGDIIYIAQVVIPATRDFRRIQERFKSGMAAIGLTGMIWHENIFRATNEIGAVKPLTGD